MERPVIARYLDIVSAVTVQLGPGWSDTQELARGVQQELDRLPDGAEKQTLQEIHVKLLESLAEFA